jgi:4-hydroxy-tetrahydrodipicolinate reductase
MGRRIIAISAEDNFFQLAGALECPGHPSLGADAGQLAGTGNLGLAVSDKVLADADVLIDFSLPAAVDDSMRFCAAEGIKLVLGTTGLSDAQLAALGGAAEKIAVVHATNMSFGMNLLFSLVGKAAEALGDDYDIEIVETHHRFKKDAPSGSALSLAQAICSATGRKYPDCLSYGRSGKDAARKPGSIGIHAVRAGDIVGQHSVIFGTLGETITLSHNAGSRDTFARGALKAAKWLLDKPAGLYSMQDVLGLK